jgi:predicted nucleic acid-binding protein
MTCQYLLDTNIISDLVRHPQGLVFQRIATVGEDMTANTREFERVPALSLDNWLL